jgi:cyclophilin family peptidyl-prolyl cis-trans isomerase
LITLNDKEYIGNQDKFMEYALHTFRFKDNKESAVFSNAAKDAYCKAINESKNRKYSFMEFQVRDEKPCKIVIELFTDIAPRTCENFVQLCNGFKKPDGEQLRYTMSEVTRIVKGMYLQAGKLKVMKTPATGASIYGREFEDESFAIKHCEVGMLGMCKRGGTKNSNESQFYITTGAPLSFLDGENVIFGRVIEGMEMLRELECLETTNERPNDQVKISACGTFKAPGK